MTFENAVRAVSIANAPERRDLPSSPRPRRPRWFLQELSSTAMNLTEVPPAATSLAWHFTCDAMAF